MNFDGGKTWNVDMHLNENFEYWTNTSFLLC